jgi:hypothetical protein
MLVDSLKPSLCIYTSLFGMSYIASQEEQPDTRTLAADYCAHLDDQLTARITLINTLLSSLSDDDAFLATCQSQLASAEPSWFNPATPSDLVSYLDTCSSLLTLFHERNSTNLATATIYTYALLYQLHLHGLEEQLY